MRPARPLARALAPPCGGGRGAISSFPFGRRGALRAGKRERSGLAVHPTLSTVMRDGWRSGLAAGLVIGLWEGWAALLASRSSLSVLPPLPALGEVTRLYFTPLWVEGLTCALLALPLSLLLLVFRRAARIWRGPRPSSGERRSSSLPLTAGAVAACLMAFMGLSVMQAGKSLPGEEAPIRIMLYLGLSVACALLGAGVGLLVERGQGKPGAAAWAGALAAALLSFSLLSPLLYVLRLRPARQLLGAAGAGIAAALLLVLAGAAAFLAWRRLRAAALLPGGPGPLVRWLDSWPLLLLALLSLPGWMIGDPSSASRASRAPSPWREDLNVLLLSVDTLRGDRLQAGDPPGGLTPNLSRLAAQGTLFTRAQAPSPWTLPSVSSLLTSLHPTAHGATRPRCRLPSSLVTLAERLSAAGLFTQAVVANGWLDFPFGMDQGFDDYRYISTRSGRPRWWPGMIGRQAASCAGLARGPSAEPEDSSTAEHLVDRAIAFLERSRGGNFFLWVHLADPHDPYAARGRFHALARPPRRPPGLFPQFDSGSIIELRQGRIVPVAERQRLLALYDLEVRYTDEQIGRLLERMADLGLQRNTLVVFTADHGEEFWEHGNLVHGHTLYQELLDIPLILRPPDGHPPAHRQREEVVSLLDVAPTILDFLGLQPPAAWSGRSLLPLLRGEGETGERPFFGESLIYYEEKKSVRQGRYKYIYTPRSGADELFDLEADPGERVNRVGELPDIAGRLRESLLAHLARQEELARALSRASTAEAEVDEKQLEELRALGYIQ